MAGLGAQVKSIIKDTVKSQSIKKKAITFDPSLLDCDLTSIAMGVSSHCNCFLNPSLNLHLQKDPDNQKLLTNEAPLTQEMQKKTRLSG